MISSMPIKMIWTMKMKKYSKDNATLTKENKSVDYYWVLKYKKKISCHSGPHKRI